MRWTGATVLAAVVTAAPGGQCVEVAHNLVPTLGVFPVRDSKVPDGPGLAVSAAAFAAFVDLVKARRPGVC
ncbi:DUF397 domain-containing protein [Streptomyces sp. NPDC058326]|uniref:DUF397 domain-containing protein n=1 Tax=Streptomyces sp. NPDC058326 TaxID=3346447 RepID=UPI0036E0598B